MKLDFFQVGCISDNIWKCGYKIGTLSHFAANYSERIKQLDNQSRWQILKHVIVTLINIDGNHLMLQIRVTHVTAQHIVTHVT